MKAPKEKCFYCGAPAVRFCDFKIGGPIGGYERIGPISDNKFWAAFALELPYTCDMALCLEHTKKVGNIFMTGANDSIDYCPEHVDADESKCVPCTEQEAQSMRSNIRALAKRNQIWRANFRQPHPNSE